MTESINSNAEMTPLKPGRTDVPVPEGYVETPLWDPFEAHMGPFFDKQIEGPDGAPELWMAFRVDDRHLNARGVVHGGMLAAFADAVTGSVAWNAVDRAPCVTLSMQKNFLKSARDGDLVECRAFTRRKTRSVIFVAAELYVEGELIMTANSLWKIIGA